MNRLEKVTPAPHSPTGTQQPWRDRNSSPWQDSEEVKTLKELIAWPEPQGSPTFNSSTSPQNCDYRILKPRASYFVGETLELLLTARDHRNRPKSYGGDFFLAKLHSPRLKAGVTGSVKDHQNGTYTVTFLLLWPGDVEVSIQLIHSSEAVQILKRLRDTYPDKVYFYGYFRRNGTEERTECNLDIPQKPVCEYIDPGTGERWVCVRPKWLPCSSLVYHSAGGVRKITSTEDEMFLNGTLTHPIIEGHLSALHVLDRNSTRGEPRPLVCTPGLPIPNPSGFYFNDVWMSRVCTGKRFPNPSDMRRCLRGKIVYMFGDSTLRQWWEYLVNVISTLIQIDLHVEHNSGPLLATDSEDSYLLQYRAHGNPLRMLKYWMADRHYVANDIDAIGGGPDLVIVLNLWAHFVTYPVDLYIRRLQSIRRAVTDLLQRSPQTTVIIKSANTGFSMLHGSDWLSLQLDIIMRKMFSGLPVAVIDTWQMTSCHYLKQDLHPGRVIVQNEIDLFLSYICPH
ncbi:NXPE family member 3 isoform X2 [Microcaecilia unicolor]|nr:NXPE family member 3-like isoform X2 [Microcaecilia unicolor]